MHVIDKISEDTGLLASSSKAYRWIYPPTQIRELARKSSAVWRPWSMETIQEDWRDNNINRLA